MGDGSCYRGEGPMANVKSSWYSVARRTVGGGGRQGFSFPELAHGCYLDARFASSWRTAVGTSSNIPSLNR